MQIYNANNNKCLMRLRFKRDISSSKIHLEKKEEKPLEIFE